MLLGHGIVILCRKAMFTGIGQDPIVVVSQEIEDICAEVDDQISLLRGVLKNNPKQKETNPEDWAFILQTIKDLEDMKKRCLRMMEGIYGNY